MKTTSASKPKYSKTHNIVYKQEFNGKVFWKNIGAILSNDANKNFIIKLDSIPLDKDLSIFAFENNKE
jgi:hypothetical protein